MAEPPRPPPPPRRFKTRAGIQRKTAEERLASIQAERLRQENQLQSPSSQAQHDTGKRTGLLPREPRTRNENTGGVFSSIGAATSSRTKSAHAVGGVEELVQGAERSENVAIPAEGSRKVKSAVGREEKAFGSTTKASGKSTKATAKKDEVIYVSDDEAEGIEGKAVDIEDIDRVSISSSSGGGNDEDDEDDDVVLSRKRRSNKTPFKPTLGLRPVRAARDPLSMGEDSHPVYAKGKRKGKGKQADKATVDQGDKMDLDQEDENAASVDEQTTPPPAKKEPPTSQSPTKHRRKSATKDTKPQFETTEERAERERYTTELRKLRHELSPISKDESPKDIGSTAPSFRPPEDSRLYLFQFPPLTPMLINPDQHPEIKAEPDPSLNTHAPPTASAPPEPKIKKEDAPLHSTASTTSGLEPAQLLTATHNPPLPSGLAGKLNVHRSGKVTLEWGSSGMTATNLEVKWGAEVDFLQDVVVLGEGGEEGDGEVEEKGKGQGNKKAWALRQVRNKFVVVPDWEKIYE